MRRAAAQALVNKAGAIRWRVSHSTAEPESLRAAVNDLLSAWADLLEAVSVALDRDPYRGV